MENEQQPQQQPDPTAAIREELLALKNELKETKEEAAYWRQHQAQQQAEEEQPEEDAVPEIDEDLADAVGSNDAKRVHAAIRKMGFASTRDVDARIQQAVQKVTTEQQIFATYPDLKKPDTPLFKATAKIYNELTAGLPKDVIAKKGSVFIERAAKLAAVDLEVEADTPAPRTRQTRTQADDDAEQTRLTRVRSQQSSRSQRDRSDDGNDELSDQQKALVARLQSIGAPITEDSYRKAAIRGVSVSGGRR